jgi:biotin synthase
MPFLELLYRASSVHRMFFNPREVQQCTLLSIKTGGCTEDCKYCAQVGQVEGGVVHPAD